VRRVFTILLDWINAQHITVANPRKVIQYFHNWNEVTKFSCRITASLKPCIGGSNSDVEQLLKIMADEIHISKPIFNVAVVSVLAKDDFDKEIKNSHPQGPINDVIRDLGIFLPSGDDVLAQILEAIQRFVKYPLLLKELNNPIISTDIVKGGIENFAAGVNNFQKLCEDNEPLIQASDSISAVMIWADILAGKSHELGKDFFYRLVFTSDLTPPEKPHYLSEFMTQRVRQLLNDKKSKCKFTSGKQDETTVILPIVKAPEKKDETAEKDEKVKKDKKDKKVEKDKKEEKDEKQTEILLTHKDPDNSPDKSPYTFIVDGRIQCETPFDKKELALLSYLQPLARIITPDYIKPFSSMSKDLLTKIPSTDKSIVAQLKTISQILSVIPYLKLLKSPNDKFYNFLDSIPLCKSACGMSFICGEYKQKCYLGSPDGAAINPTFMPPQWDFYNQLPQQSDNTDSIPIPQQIIEKDKDDFVQEE